MNITMGKGSKMTVNGKSYNGGSVTISNGVVIVDGVVQDGEVTGNINVVVHGDVSNLETNTGNVTANNVGQISTGSGDVDCNDVRGSIGDVNSGRVGGSIRTGSGDVRHG